MSSIVDRLEEEILVLDGAMGTELQKRGLEVGDCPEELNLTHPKILKEIHSSYVKAGSDIIQTNTFGANRLKLAEYNLAHKIEKINQQAVKLATEVAGDDVFISASIGPTGKLLEPLGDLSFQQAYHVFGEQAQILEAAGADLINIETMTDLQEARAALIAVKEKTSLPVIINLTYEENLKTMTGTDPQTAITVFEALGADVIGANCSLGPKKLVEIIKLMGQYTATPLCVQPNAGLPVLNENNETIFPMEALEMANYIPQFIEAGVNIIGGCCGSTPEYINLAKKKVVDITPASRIKKKETTLASRTKRVVISDNLPTRIIGERINPTGREELSHQLADEKMELVAKEASNQVQAGADILDVNVGVPQIDQAQAMKLALNTVHNVVDIPVSIDTTNQEVLEAGLQTIVGKPLINSVTGEEESLNTVLPLAKKYGAAVLGLTLDEDGIPATAQGRLKVAKKILNRAQQLGIKRENVLIDTLTLAASAEQDKVLETIKAIELIKEELGLATVLGVSNISYGLPAREEVNTAFLAMAIQAGLNAPILDPTNKAMQATLKASDLLVNRDLQGQNYLNHYSNQEERKKEEKEEKLETTDSLTKLYHLVLEGDKDNIISEIEQALTDHQALEIINQALIPGIKEVGAKYDEGTYFLPQLMMSAETMQEAFTKLRPILQEEDNQQTIGRVLLATVKGDIHDIGKNIVKVMLENNGFEIIDLGKDVANDKIITKAIEQEVDLVGLSALMTTTMPNMEKITMILKEKAPEIKILLGGAVVTRDYANNIGADGYAQNAVEAVKKATELINNSKN
ncbi:Homocysteine S-methyltransferase/B12 binding domain/Pterin binding enzyme [Halobacteroides halobius DSM 5150]|uniref:Methionine synthase n=1 Tax=Halobacteroides halobius (strain ATCC 35273 / DSM 5150 / MD-1) TaxID=748449 RepID=L0K7J3_HALHC|nr:homocysteine S-methyltransferase family protein [Halobacteroides halobius]AGB41257.1 Homocysteine S-methyltransferase/B12 binding domain/Pterin binding enzyme [Halobacteroides halobius DSM 5150]